MKTAGDRAQRVSASLGAPGRAGIGAAIAIGVWSLGDHALPRGLPLGVVLQGAMFGSLYALVALGLVLIFRANRVINFAQAELGGIAAVLAIEFRLRLGWNYFLAIAAGLAIAVVLGGAIEVVVMRRFANAPRLIVAVVTIGLAQVLNGFSVLIPVKWNGLFKATRFTTPFNAHFKVYPVVFDGNAVLALVVVPVVLLGLTAFLRFTDYGVAIRAAAENGDRARLLGIPVRGLSTMVWAIGGFLSALAILLRVPLLGFASFTSVSGGGYSLLLYVLTAAVIGAMTSMPLTAVAAVGLGVVQSLGAWTFRNSTYVDALLLVVILAALLVRRERFNRAAEAGVGTWRALKEVRPIPTELRNLPEVRGGLFALRAILVAGALVFPFVASPARSQLAALILIYGMVAVSLVVLTGWAGHLSLGHWALVGFGGAATGTLLVAHGWDLFLAVPAGALVAAAAAFLIGLPALRISGPFLAVTTLAFAVTSSSFFLRHRFVPWFVPDFVPRPALWNRIAFGSDRQMYFVCLGALVLVMLAARSLRNSRTGRVLIATRDNVPGTQSMSINTTRAKLTAFAISGAIAGSAGALYVLHQAAFKSDAYTPDISLRVFSMVVIGGLSSLPGAILGATFIKGAEFFLRGGWATIASGAGIVGLLLVLPEGLGGFLYVLRDAALRRLATRRGLVVPSLVADMRVETEEAPVALDLALAGLARRPTGEVTGGNGELAGASRSPQAVGVPAGAVDG
jgi:branched-chain amino acid transport system permease protein